MSADLPAGASLVEAQDWMLARAADGVRCPCCTQNVKIYKRSMTSVTARAMIVMYRHGREFIHLPTLVKTNLPDVAHQGGYASLAHYWGLIEEERVRRPDGGRAGWWRLTDTGLAFVRGSYQVQRRALIFNGERFGFDGERVGISEVLGRSFSYEELMAGV